MESFDILIVGGGAAGISAARAACRAGFRSILLADRRDALGGILRQCAHRGFGAGLSGPEYLEKLTADLPEEITLWLNATVTEVRGNRSARILGPEIGERLVSFRQLILAAGCREIPIGALPIAGTRPGGIFTAGQMQEMMNLRGFLPQGPAVILGSGDLGLILADQLSEIGLDVTLVERKPDCGGMAKNRRCLERGNVRLHCNCTIEEIFGQKNIESLQLTGGKRIPCKTLLIAVGLRPEREVIFGLGMPAWLHLCGNCRRVHPMVEAVVNEGTQAGFAAWKETGGIL